MKKLLLMLSLIACMTACSSDDPTDNFIDNDFISNLASGDNAITYARSHFYSYELVDGEWEEAHLSADWDADPHKIIIKDGYIWTDYPAGFPITHKLHDLWHEYSTRTGETPEYYIKSKFNYDSDNGTITMSDRVYKVESITPAKLVINLKNEDDFYCSLEYDIVEGALPNTNSLLAFSTQRAIREDHQCRLIETFGPKVYITDIWPYIEYLAGYYIDLAADVDEWWSHTDFKKD